MRIAIPKIVIGDRSRKDLGNIKELADSMKRCGLINAVVVNSSNKLIAGERRIRAAEMLGWREIECRVIDSFDEAVTAMHAERDENTCRKDFTPSEAVAIGKRLEEIERPRAKERQAATQMKGKDRKGNPVIGSGNLPEPKEGHKHKHETRERVGSAVGMSGVTYQRAKAVVDAAEADPEKYGDLKEKMDSGSVNGAYTEMQSRMGNPQPKQESTKSDNCEIKVRGVGIIIAIEAIDCLKRIPQNDALRKRGFQRVQDWIKAELKG